MWTGLIWLTVGDNVGLLLTKQWTFRFYKMQGIYWVAKELTATHEDPHCKEFISWSWFPDELQISHVLCCLLVLYQKQKDLTTTQIKCTGCVRAAWRVTLNKNGSFSPQVVTPLPSHIPQCKALYDFRMTNDDEEGCLTFNKVSGILL